MSPSVLDTDIFSETTKRKSPRVVERAERYIDEHGQLAITVVTVTEVVSGYQRMQRETLIQRFLSSLGDVAVLPLTTTASVLAGRIIGDLLRNGQPIGNFDPLIAAIAIEQQRTLATGNIRHYRRVVELGYDLKLEDWREPEPA